jgi:hypothetical protein
MLCHNYSEMVYYPRLLTTLLRNTTFNGKGSCVGGWVEAWSHLGYDMPQLLSCVPLDLVS